jgi:enoyl-[acyl-carrier protein] reductase I
MAEGLLKGKRGVVLGVANDKSIAWACAKLCAEQGAEMIFNYIDFTKKRVAKLSEELPGDTPMLPCDVSDDDAITGFFAEVGKRWGSIDFVIHSLAYAEREDLKGRFVNTNRANFAKALDISAYSLVAVAREAAPLMTNGGSILAMTYYGAEKVVPNYNIMGVAKAALEASGRYLAADLGPQNIRVNCLSAGPIRTLSSSAIPGMRAMLDVTEKAAPLRRNTNADEVAKSSLYLLSDLSTGVSGEVHHVDCGYNVLGMIPPEIITGE